MKNIRALFLLLLAMPALLITQQTCDPNSAPVQENSFVWQYENISYKANMDTAYQSSIPFAPLILATRGNSLFIPSAEMQIGLTSLNLGTYSFTPGSGNRMNFTDAVGNSLASTGGSLNISSSSPTSIWGSFTITLDNGKTISGNFLNTPVRP